MLKIKSEVLREKHSVLLLKKKLLQHEQELSFLRTSCLNGSVQQVAATIPSESGSATPHNILQLSSGEGIFLHLILQTGDVLSSAINITTGGQVQ